MRKHRKKTSARMLASVLAIILILPTQLGAIPVGAAEWDKGTGLASPISVSGLNNSVPAFIAGPTVSAIGPATSAGTERWDTSPVSLSQDDPTLLDEPEVAAPALDDSGDEDEDASALLPVDGVLAPMMALAPLTVETAQVASAAQLANLDAASITPLANSSTVIDFDGFDFGTDVAAGIYANWSYAASNRTFTVTDDVSVIGTVSGAAQTLTFNIASGKTVKWGADYEGDTFDTTGLIYLTDAGTFEVTSGSIANSNVMMPRNTIVGKASAVIKVSGGTVSAVLGYAIYTGGDVVVSGGTVSTDSGYAIRSLSDVTVSGGTVSSTSEAALYVGTGGTLTVSGGIVFACDAGTTGSGNIFRGGATFELNPVASDNGVAVVWNNSVGTATYIEGTNDDLTVSSGATATWHNDTTLGGGISYANGTNSGFFALPVTVNVPTYALTVNAGTGGSVSGTASGSYQEGESVSVTATADTDYLFTGWTASGVTLASSTDNPAMFSMPANAVTLTANFVYNPPPPGTWPVLEHFDDFTGSGISSARVAADHVEFIRLLKDGVEVHSGHYAITSGSTVITFNEAYLKTLDNGTHWYIAEYGDFMSSENIRLIVNVANTQNLTSGSNDAALPKTGNNTTLAWYIALALSILGGLCLLVRHKRRQLKELPNQVNYSIARVNKVS